MPNMRHRDRGRAVLVDARTERRERPAGQLDHLERPHDAAPVAGLHARGGDRVELGQPFVGAGEAGVVGRRVARARRAPRDRWAGSRARRRRRARRGRCRPRGSPASRAPRCRRSRRARRPACAAPTTPPPGRRRRRGGARPPRARPAWAWRCRCRGPGTPASSRARRAPRRPRRRANSSATADLPEAVGPTSARCRVKLRRPGCGRAAGAPDGPGRSCRPAASAAAAYVTRTPTVAPAAVVGSGAKCTSLLCRVRPDHIAGSVFDGPSTSTSSTCADPRRVLLQRRRLRPRPSGAACVPCTTSGSTKSSVIVAASVPGRGENTNVYAASYCAAATTSSVASKSCSVSPGKPTMMSVVTARPSIAARAAARRSR